MNLEEVEEERLKHGRGCICKVAETITILSEAQNTIHLHPGAKRPQYSDKSSTTSFDARASGHRRCNGREFCSCTTFEKKSGSLCTKCFFYRVSQRRSFAPQHKLTKQSSPSTPVSLNSWLRLSDANPSWRHFSRVPSGAVSTCKREFVQI
jgi:hypothetical protein